MSAAETVRQERFLPRSDRKAGPFSRRGTCRPAPLLRCAVLLGAVPGLAACSGQPDREFSDVGGPSQDVPVFVAHQPELFFADGAQPNAWADYDGDGDLDLFVGFRGRANRLYRNDGGTFVDVADQVGLADEAETRAAAWGDYDGDGDFDLYVGFRLDPETPNRLYRNDGGLFTDVAPELGLDVVGNTRQPSWVDYDGDGDVDLFVAFREQPNRLWRNDGGRFTEVTTESGIGDPRRTVGTAWFDMDGDGDLDLFVANQTGDEDGVFLNDGGVFTDFAGEWEMNQPGRAEELGSVGVAVADYDNDGDLDLFVASYGPDVLWENQGGGSFRNTAPGTALAGDHHSVAAAFGDYDNDGWVDLFVGAYLSDVPEEPDHLFRNVEGTFRAVTPENILARGASHGVAWADYDNDGDLDLALDNNNAAGMHPLYRNEMDDPGRSLAVVVTDEAGRWTRAGAEVTLLVGGEMPDGSPRYISTRLVSTGGGYSSQGAVPVHFGIPGGVERVDVMVRWFEDGAVHVQRVEDVDPSDYAGRSLEIRTGGR